MYLFALVACAGFWWELWAAIPTWLRCCSSSRLRAASSLASRNSWHSRCPAHRYTSTKLHQCYTQKTKLWALLSSAELWSFSKAKRCASTCMAHPILFCSLCKLCEAMCKLCKLICQVDMSSLSHWMSRTGRTSLVRSKWPCLCSAALRRLTSTRASRSRRAALGWQRHRSKHQSVSHYSLVSLSIS